MNHFKVRVQNPTAIGFLTQADHYRDYELESTESIEDFSARLAARGFADPDGRWIMPGAIIWIEQT